MYLHSLAHDLCTADVLMVICEDSSGFVSNNMMMDEMKVCEYHRCG